MVMAVLHVICGNCGCNSEFEWEYIPKDKVSGEEADALLACKNCSTNHYISDNAKPKPQKG